jgi:phytol kinase
MNDFGEFISQLFYPLSLIFGYLALLVAIAEVASRSIEDDPELTRKIVHIGSGNVILLAWWLQIETWVIIAAAIIASIIAIISYIVPILPSINSVGRKSLGTLFYAISIGILAYLFWDDFPQYTAIGILIMAWGDGMAAIVGQRFGKHTYRLGQNTKSWEGSLAMAAASYLVIISILWFVLGDRWEIWVTAFIISIVATILEAFSQLGIDNLTVPLVSAFLLFWCSQIFLTS